VRETIAPKFQIKNVSTNLDLKKKCFKKFGFIVGIHGIALRFEEYICFDLILFLLFMIKLDHSSFKIRMCNLLICFDVVFSGLFENQ